MQRLLAFTLVALLGGCSHAPFYAGDGRFVDNGLLAYSRRYEIDLGPVDVSRPASYRYTLRGLPRAEFVVLLQVVDEAPNTKGKERNYPATVHMQLWNQKGETVIDEQSPLDSWVRGYGQGSTSSELYRRGKGIDTPVPGGGTRSQRIEVNASGGWGTYFYSEPEDTYELAVWILASDMKRPTRLVVSGWGRD